MSLASGRFCASSQPNLLLSTERKLSVTAYFCNEMCVIISNCVKQIFDFVADFSAKLAHDNDAAVNVLRSLSVVRFRSSSVSDKANSWNTAVMAYSSCSRVVGAYCLEYCVCVEQLLRWCTGRPLLHAWRLVERRAHRKEFRRKHISPCCALVLCVMKCGVKVLLSV